MVEKIINTETLELQEKIYLVRKMDEMREEIKEMDIVEARTFVEMCWQDLQYIKSQKVSLSALKKIIKQYPFEDKIIKRQRGQKK